MKRAREDEVGVDGAGPSHRRRADEDSEIVLPRESYGRASAAAPSGMNGALRNIRSHESYGWLQQDSPRLGAYIPQMGDALVYIPQGHAEFLDSRNNKAASKPWNAISGMRNIEPVQWWGSITSFRRMDGTKPWRTCGCGWRTLLPQALEPIRG